MAVSGRRRSWFEYPDAFIVVWTVVMFLVFGLLSNLYDQESFSYNLGQVLFVALTVGAILYVVRWAARGRKKAGR
ncbi:MAG: hypothetical protein ACLQEQ_08655 [Nitrososphaerales archaeon]